MITAEKRNILSSRYKSTHTRLGGIDELELPVETVMYTSSSSK